tara:strand:+ start:141 stop:449 length:309 start_codon:yes stop_codon:yes gene_type:complete
MSETNNIILDDNYINLYKNYDVKKNITEPILTKYEYTKILGIRTQQIALGSEPLIEVTKDLNSVQLIAEEEIRQRKTPIILKRQIGVDKFEYWKLEDLAIYN